MRSRRGHRSWSTGCGTSEHAAQGVAEILREAVRAARLTGPGGIAAREPSAEQALELSLDPPSTGLVIGISHEGGTTATNAALAAARDAGARTALITVTDRSPGAQHAHLVLETEELDQGWCHTVGYVSPLVAAIAVGAHLARRPVDEALRANVRDALQAGVDRASIVEAVASRLAGVRQVLVVASGSDRPAGRELTLKIEEGTWIPAAYRDLETFLHGHLAATDESTGLVLILTDRERRARPRRARWRRPARRPGHRHGDDRDRGRRYRRRPADRTDPGRPDRRPRGSGPPLPGGRPPRHRDPAPDSSPNVSPEHAASTQTPSTATSTNTGRRLTRRTPTESFDAAEARSSLS